MGYPQDLDEISEARLRGELLRREGLRRAGCCDYCEQLLTRPPCRFPERHTKHRPDLEEL